MHCGVEFFIGEEVYEFEEHDSTKGRSDCKDKTVISVKFVYEIWRLLYYRLFPQKSSQNPHSQKEPALYH